MDAKNLPNPDDLLIRFIRNLELLLGAEYREAPWVAALSGGPDSTALCLLLRLARSRSGGEACMTQRIVALHVNHGLRGPAADADQAFSASLAEEMGFEFQVRSLDPTSKPARGSLEAWARKNRYRALEQTAKHLGAGLVLTGHHRDDQAETVMQRLMRGAGFNGLSGIRALRPLALGSDLFLARPLLPFRRREILTFLERHNRSYIIDHTNLDETFQRNRIRHRLLPRLSEAFQPKSLTDELCGIAEIAADINETLEAAGFRLLKRVSKDTEITQPLFAPFRIPEEPSGPLIRAPLVLDRKALDRVHPLLKHPLLKCALKQLVPHEEPHLTRSGFEAAVRLMPSKAGPVSARLTRQIQIRAREKELIIESIGEEKPAIKKDTAMPLSVPGRVQLPSGEWIAARPAENRTEAKALISAPDPLTEVLDLDRIKHPLSIRRRRPGDRFHPLGAPGKRKLKHFLIDAKVSQRERDHLALVMHGDEILWVAGLRISHACRVRPETKRYLILEAGKSARDCHLRWLSS